MSTCSQVHKPHRKSCINSTDYPISIVIQHGRHRERWHPNLTYGRNQSAKLSQSSEKLLCSFPVIFISILIPSIAPPAKCSLICFNSIYISPQIHQVLAMFGNIPANHSQPYNFPSKLVNFLIPSLHPPFQLSYEIVPAAQQLEFTNALIRAFATCFRWASRR